MSIICNEPRLLARSRYLVTFYYKSINRSPVRHEYRDWDNTVLIHWKCHGINSDGNREYWHEITITEVYEYQTEEKTQS